MYAYMCPVHIVSIISISLHSFVTFFRQAKISLLGSHIHFFVALRRVLRKKYPQVLALEICPSWIRVTLDNSCLSRVFIFLKVIDAKKCAKSYFFVSSRIFHQTAFQQPVHFYSRHAYNKDWSIDGVKSRSIGNQPPVKNYETTYIARHKLHSATGAYHTILYSRNNLVQFPFPKSTQAI